MNIRSVLVTSLTVLLVTGAGTASMWRDPSAQAPAQGGEIEKLRAELDRPGPEAADARLVAIESLLSMLDIRAHAALQDKLGGDDQDAGVRREILDALFRRLRNTSDKVFGTAAGQEGRELRSQILRSYVPALVELYRRTEGAVDEEAVELRRKTRACLARMPMRDLEEGLRQLVDLPTQEREMKEAAFRVAADCQDLYLARFLADYLEAPDPHIRNAAHANLQLLTLADTQILTRAQFDEWWKHNGTKRYLELVEEAARRAASRFQMQRAQYERRLTETIVSLVIALYENRTSVDWAGIQQQVLASEPPDITEVCLERLRQRLQDDLHPGNNAPQRHAFHKALLQRLAQVGDGQPRLQSLLLETAAYLLRPDEQELVADMVPQLVARLDSPHPLVQRAALRGLRRYPSAANRGAVVQAARQAMAAGGAEGRETLRVALETLGHTSPPVWHAPSPDDADKQDWLDLLRALFQREGFADLRLTAMGVARLPDESGQRLPEVFQELLALVKNPAQGYELRKTGLIYLQDYTDVPEKADAYVREVLGLLDDPEREIRQFAANKLAELPANHSEAKKREWIQSVVQRVRQRLLTEPNLGVFQSLVSCMTNCARPPGTPERIIGSLQLTLDELLKRGQEEQEPARIEALLKALTTLAAEPLNDPGQWIVVGERLLAHGKRRDLRLVLSSQHAIGLSEDIDSEDRGKAELARRAMWLIVRAATLRDGKEPWNANEALKEEAQDVRGALAALDQLPEAQTDTPAIRLLRVRVLHDLGAHQKATEWTARYLEGDPSRSGLSAEQVDEIRLLAADSHLAQGRLDDAARRLNALDPARAGMPRALSLAERVGRGYLEGGAPAKAVTWLEKATNGTPTSAPGYRQRLLGYAEALLKADMAANRQKVNELLDAHAALFEEPCPKELRDAFQALRGAN